MKKLIAIIIILAIIFVGMVVYKKVAINTSNNISIQEISQIETYITKIYMWKEITGQALPNFEDINQAEDVWIWEVVKKNLEDYEFFYEEIQEKAKDLFGERLTEDLFRLNEIQRTPTGYEVEIIEYLEDYSQTLNEEDDFVIIRNTKEEEIGRVNSTEEEKVKEMVKNHIDKLSRKKIVLKQQNEKLQVEKVYEE